MVKMFHQQMRYEQPRLVQCWASVAEVRPTFKRHWVNAPFSCVTNVLQYRKFKDNPLVMPNCMSCWSYAELSVDEWITARRLTVLTSSGGYGTSKDTGWKMTRKERNDF